MRSAGFHNRLSQLVDIEGFSPVNTIAQLFKALQFPKARNNSTSPSANTPIIVKMDKAKMHSDLLAKIGDPR